jgi:hypothetical protein
MALNYKMQLRWSISFIQIFLIVLNHLTYRRKRPLHTIFWYVDENDVDRSYPMFACDRVEGTQKIHCIFATNKNAPTQLLVKPLACFCAFCIDGRWLECPNLKWTGDWISRHFQPIDNIFVRDFIYDA